MPTELNSETPCFDDDDETNWVDQGWDTLPTDTAMPDLGRVETVKHQRSPLKSLKTLAMVESAFLASTASLIWLINYYFPLGPVLTIFFPIPLALVYLRWGPKTAIKGVIAAVLLLSVLMGPTRSIVFLMPYGLMSLQLGFCWQRNAPWFFSILSGGLIGAFGFFFRFWLFSILLGEDLWRYVITQITNLLDWVFLKLNLLAQPDFMLVQAIAVGMILLNSLFYLVAVHLMALLILDRIGNRIPRPPRWVSVILDYE